MSRDILWGVASSAYQIEGDGKDSGKGKSIVDLQQTDDLIKIASDQYGRYKEDVELMKEMGAQTYYMSIAWSRILPDGNGEINQKGIDYYKSLFQELRKKNITPIVTLVHFDIPAALIEQYNGWHSRKIIKDFTRYCEICFKEFKEYVGYWIPISGLNAECQIPRFNGGCDNPENMEEWTFRVAHIKLLCHAIAVDLCRKLCPLAKVGTALEYSIIYPKTCNPMDKLAVFRKNMHDIFYYADTIVYGAYPKIAWSWLQKKGICPNIEEGDLEILEKGKPDFIGLFYYESLTVMWCPEDAEHVAGEYNLSRTGKKGSRVLKRVPGMYAVVENDYLQTTDWDWFIDPKGLYLSLFELYDRYHLPLLIAENGYGCIEENICDEMIEDDERIQYLKAHIKELLEAADDGIEILSYNIWSSIDLVSTSNGFQKRYGLVHVDYDEEHVCDLKRVPKKSFYWYKKVIETDGEYVNR